jgi:hypothetical protein
MSNSEKTLKKEKAKELYLKYHTLERRELINKFQAELGMSENSARTHISLCAKELNNTLSKPYITRNINQSGLKRQKAMEIFRSNPSFNRKQMIETFMKELNMSRNSAATHCSMCAKAYTDSVPHNAV